MVKNTDCEDKILKREGTKNEMKRMGEEEEKGSLGEEEDEGSKT